MKRIILFDIDGTLIHSGSELGKLHHASFLYAFKEIYNLEILDEEFQGYSGRTDMFVIKDILANRGLDDAEISENITKMFQCMTKYFDENLGAGEYKENVIDQVVEVLDMLNQDENYIVGLLSGNVKGIAKRKLEVVNLWHYFKIGGFGDSSDLRENLIDIAVNDAVEKKFSDTVDIKQVYIVGDTKYDILCAKERGAVSVAVTTGKFTKADLEIYKPDYLLDNLSTLIPKISGSE